MKINMKITRSHLKQFGIYHVCYVLLSANSKTFYLCCCSFPLFTSFINKFYFSFLIAQFVCLVVTVGHVLLNKTVQSFCLEKSTRGYFGYETVQKKMHFLHTFLINCIQNSYKFVLSFTRWLCCMRY